jgi:hypothetical protein
MPLSPRVLLSIDYEPWFALFRHYDHLRDTDQRRELDSSFTRLALEPILEQLGSARISFYLVGEIAEWYPEVPKKIVGRGHELGLHCHIHRPLMNVEELAGDLTESLAWCRQYAVRGYRAPMVGIHEEAYALLERSGFQYSSSIYAPTGTLLQRGKMWEIPVSTVRLRAGTEPYTAPRDFSSRLLLQGEFPYGSSFSIGLLGKGILGFIGRELKRGLCPSIILHPYELVKPPSSTRLRRDLMLNPHLVPFLRDKSGFLKDLLRNFPVSALGTYLDEALTLMGKQNA